MSEWGPCLCAGSGGVLSAHWLFLLESWLVTNLGCLKSILNRSPQSFFFFLGVFRYLEVVLASQKLPSLAVATPTPLPRVCWKELEAGLSSATV